MRTISELLTIMRDSEDLFKLYCNGGGLCKLSVRLTSSGIIAWPEHVRIIHFIDCNRPDKRSKHYYPSKYYSAYYWPQGMWEPREAWLDTQIIKQKRLEKKANIT